MARVTSEDCIEKIPNRFELVAIAAQRNKDICSGIPATIEVGKDKTPVISLREIALGNLDIDHLREEIISSFQACNKVDEIDDENLHAEAKEQVNEQDYSQEEEGQESNLFFDSSYTPTSDND